MQHFQAPDCIIGEVGYKVTDVTKSNTGESIEYQLHLNAI
jgi:hypothetical protein